MFNSFAKSQGGLKVYVTAGQPRLFRNARLITLFMGVLNLIQAEPAEIGSEGLNMP